VTQQPVVPNFGDPNWRIGFSAVAGGVVNLSGKLPEHMPELLAKLTAAELNVLQRLPESTLIQDLLSAQERSTLNTDPLRSRYPDHQVWLSIERILRRYAQYHFDRPIRSATLIDTCFTSNNTPFLLQTS
jgi:DNA repair protein RecO (recombination protein O)